MNTHGKGIPRKYFFKDMAIGDSAIYEGDAKNTRSALCIWNKKLNWKFKTRMTNKGLKVCRVK